MTLSSNWRKALAPLILSVLLLLTSCAPKTASQFDQAQQDSTRANAQPAVAKNAEQGSSFNRFFPDPTDGFDRVYSQEKKGFAEAKLKKDGKDVAMLSISDTISLPAAAQKYKSSTETVNGYPALEIGATQTGVLVADRYQVKVLSRDNSFTKADRRTWIQRFDLSGLSNLK